MQIKCRSVYLSNKEEEDLQETVFSSNKEDQYLAKDGLANKKKNIDVRKKENMINYGKITDVTDHTPRPTRPLPKIHPSTTPDALSTPQQRKLVVMNKVPLVVPVEKNMKKSGEHIRDYIERKEDQFDTSRRIKDSRSRYLKKTKLNMRNPRPKPTPWWWRFTRSQEMRDRTTVTGTTQTQTPSTTAKTTVPETTLTKISTKVSMGRTSITSTSQTPTPDKAGGPVLNAIRNDGLHPLHRGHGDTLHPVKPVRGDVIQPLRHDLDDDDIRGQQQVMGSILTNQLGVMPVHKERTVYEPPDEPLQPVEKLPGEPEEPPAQVVKQPVALSPVKEATSSHSPIPADDGPDAAYVQEEIGNGSHVADSGLSQEEEDQAATRGKAAAMGSGKI